MRRFLLSALPLAAATVAMALAAPASAAERRFNVGGFDRVETRTPFDVRVHTGVAPGVRAVGPQEMLDRLDIQVRGGVLRVDMLRDRGGFSWSGTRQRVQIEVGVPMVQGAALSGPGNLTVDRIQTPRFAAALSGPGNLVIGMIETRQLNATLSGPGDLTVTGRADAINLLLSGPGDIRARGLTARDATVMLSGPGNIDATVTGTVRGTLNGPGDITIAGGARCDISKHGPGDVRCR